MNSRKEMLAHIKSSNYTEIVKLIIEGKLDNDEVWKEVSPHTIEEAAVANEWVVTQAIDILNGNE
ncbi:MAG: hypothetical protein J7497_00350 [Chitinophagaceae bacterium]|nr:hypothetical protein [Chitinophagaceae bacterium]